MVTLFVADLHLNEQEPEITEGFLKFLRQEAVSADAIYILGDLFDVWVGDDDPNPLHKRVAQALLILTQSGVRCFFIHGNRDFMLGKRFAKKCGLEILSEEYLLNLYGQPLLLLHGDTLCTDDLSYQKFRRYVNNKLLQKLFLCMPFSWRQKIGGRLRRTSQSSNQQKAALIMDVNADTIDASFTRYQVTLMIHGHTHRPAIHTHSSNSLECTRVVLGNWYNDRGSVMHFYPDHSFKLVDWPFSVATNLD